MRRVSSLARIGRLARIARLASRSVGFGGGGARASTPAREWSWAASYALPDVAEWPEQSELLTQARSYSAPLVPMVMQTGFDPSATMATDSAAMAALDAAIIAGVPDGYGGLALLDHETPTFSLWRQSASSDADVMLAVEYCAALLARAKQVRPEARWGMYGMPRRPGSEITWTEWHRRVAMSAPLWAASDAVHVGCYVTTWDPEQWLHDECTTVLSESGAWARPTYAWICPRYSRGSAVAAEHGRQIPEAYLASRARALAAAGGTSPWVRGICVWDGARADSDEDRAELIAQADVCWRAVIAAMRGAQ